MKKMMPANVVIGVARPISSNDVPSRQEKIRARGILIRKAEAIPWIITGMDSPYPLKNPMDEKRMQVRMHSGEKPFR